MPKMKVPKDRVGQLVVVPLGTILAHLNHLVMDNMIAEFEKDREVLEGRLTGDESFGTPEAAYSPPFLADCHLLYGIK